MTRIGIISDTHGLLRPEALAQLSGSDYIVHGGDIGNSAILDQLASLAPLTAVRGNNDHGPWADAVPDTAMLETGGVRIYAVHDIACIDIDPAAADVQVVVYGHSHRPLVERRAGVLYINPGSAGPRRFKLPITVAELIVDGSSLAARIIELPVAASVRRA
jgi:uncharacterized protein